MRRLLAILAALVASLALAACAVHLSNSGRGELRPKQPDALRLASWNVHYIWLDRETGPWSVGDWMERRAGVSSLAGLLDADILAFQEMESFGRNSRNGEINLALDYLLAEHPGYRAAAVGDPARFPSTQPIFYRPDRLELIDQGWFFFSTTPDVIYSRTFDGSFPAFTSWALFRDLRSGRTIRVLNLHTDARSGSNRLASAELVAARASPWIASGEAVVVLGDLNARAGAPTLGILEDAGFTFPPVPGATFHFNRGLNLFGAIDHIGLAGPVAPLSDPVVLRRRVDGRWPSDHYPVVLDVTLVP